MCKIVRLDKGYEIGEREKDMWQLTFVLNTQIY